MANRPGGGQEFEADIRYAGPPGPPVGVTPPGPVGITPPGPVGVTPPGPVGVTPPVRRARPAAVPLFLARYHGATSGLSNGFAPIAGQGSHIPRFPLRKELSLVPIPPQLSCLVCQDVMRNPVMLACRHELCADCYEQERARCNTSGKQLACPVDNCGQPIVTGPTTNVHTREALETIKIRCINGVSYNVGLSKFNRLKLDTRDVVPPPPDDYCKEVLSLESIEQHFRSCPYTPRRCKLFAKGCQDVFLHRDMNAHRASCKFQLMKCRFCETTLTQAQVQQHEANECQLVVVACSYERYGCKSKLTRMDQAEHVQVCPFGAPAVRNSFERLLADYDVLQQKLKGERQTAMDLQHQIDQCQQQRAGVGRMGPPSPYPSQYPAQYPTALPYCYPANSYPAHKK